MTTDQRIVQATGELLRRQGYAATGLKQIATASAAPTGSLYHHFPGGKAELVERVLRETGAAYGDLVELLLAGHDDLASVLVDAFAAAADNVEENGWASMCPVATVSGEVADLEPALREAGAEAVASWLDRGTRLLTERWLGADDARELMLAVLAALEGGFLLARVLRSREPLVAAGRAVAAHAASLPRRTDALGFTPSGPHRLAAQDPALSRR